MIPPPSALARTTHVRRTVVAPEGTERAAASSVPRPSRRPASASVRPGPLSGSRASPLGASPNKPPARSTKVRFRFLFI